MFNPNTQIPKDGQDVGTSPQNNLNDPNFQTNQGSNTFTLSFQNLLTARYGEITPYNYLTCIGRDRIRLNSSHDLRSYTLSSPLMSSLRMRKSNFSVPISAIMPNTYKYLKVNPVKGSDVPDDAYCFVDLLRFVYALSYEGKHQIEPKFPYAFKLFLLCYLLLSKGSLLDYLGISFSAILPDSFTIADLHCTSIDSVFDKIVQLCVSNTDTLETQFYIRYSTTDFTTGQGERQDTILQGGSLSAVRDCFMTMFEYPDFELTIGETIKSAIFPYISGFFNFIVTTFSDKIFDNASTSSISPSYRPFNVNLYKLVAYQMSCAQFYTNDTVDNVYNSDLWLDNQRSLLFANNKVSSDSFYYNGVRVLYDVFSNHLLTLEGKLYDFTNSFSVDPALDIIYFWFNLLSFRRSLRYGDYFNGARTQPLAVGNVDVPVVGNNVSVIDINRNLHMQRFLNAVNRTKSTIYDYCRGIFGYTPTKLNPTPACISTETLFVGSDEIENTAQEQGTVNTNLRAAQSHFEYDVTLTDDCIILGLISFECTSSYDKSVERDNFHINRFDEYIPELQHIGDQEVYPVERNARDFDRLSAFGYQVRYAEYKFKFNQMHGGFTYNLPSWAFVTDVDRTSHLDEDSIRSYPAEFDKFYKSLTNSSLAGYYHFVISFANNIDANRPMDYQPRLL